MKTKVLLGLSLFAVSVLAAFAPPGVVFSPQTFLAPPVGVTSESSSTDALIATGTAPIEDGVLVTNDAATGIHVFRVHETTGLELHFGLEGALGVTGTARVWRAIPVTSAQNVSDPVVQWTYRHVCDVSLTASAQTGVGTTGHVVPSTFRWASVVVNSSADGGLSTRAVNGTTTNAAGSLFVDPVCAPIIVVQVKRDTASGIVPLAMNWTKN